MQLQGRANKTRGPVRGKVVIMGQAAKRTTNKRGQSAQRRQQDAGEAAAIELLGVWMLISQLRETLRDDRRRSVLARAAMRTRRRSTERRERARRAIRRHTRPISSCD